MRCERCREALSAELDGEDPGLPAAAVAAHLAGCAACRAYQRRLADLHRLTRVRQAEEVPDLSAAVLAHVAPRPSRRGAGATPHDAVLGWLRSGLVFVGVVLVGLAGALLLAGDATTPAHLAAWDVAFGGALLVAAVQPDRARGLVPMAALVVVSMTAASLVEISTGHDPTHGLVFHAAELAGVVLLVLLARHRHTGRRTSTGLASA